MSWIRMQWTFVLIVLCSQTAHASKVFEIRKRDGSHISDATVQELNPEQLRIQVENKQHDLPLTSIVGLHSVRVPQRQSSNTAVLRLVNGDILSGTLVSLDNSGLKWALNPADDNSAIRLEIPLEYVLGITFGSTLNDSLKSLIPKNPQTGSDKIRLANGDELSGELSELTLEELTLETETGATNLLLKSVQLILFNEELTETPTLTPQRTLIMLEPGTRISLSDFNISRNSMVSGELIFGESLKVPLNQVSRVVLLDATVQALSEREPDLVSYQPFLSSILEYRRNLGVLENPLQIEHSHYLTGLGMHSRTELTWKLSKTDEFLISWIGLDVSAGQQGNVRFRILLDGDQVFESPQMTGKDPSAIDPDRSSEQGKPNSHRGFRPGRRCTRLRNLGRHTRFGRSQCTLS